MKKIRLIFFLIFLSSCNQYLGNVDPDYIPSKELTDIFSNNQNDFELNEVNLGDILFPDNINSDLEINILEINKITNLDKNSIISFFDNKIYFNINDNIYLIDKQTNQEIAKLKLKLKNDEEVLNFFKYREDVYIITNMSRLFVLNDKKASIFADYEILINTKPILLNDKLTIFSVFGEIHEINLINKQINKKNIINLKPGTSLFSNVFEDKVNLYYLFNTATLLTYNKSYLKFNNNYILDDLNMLSSVGPFNDLLDTPFTFKNYLYFLDRHGKIAVFNPKSTNILWELNVNSTIIKYLFTNEGQLIILTSDKIIILSQNGDLIYQYLHNKEFPISIIHSKGDIYLISEEGITSINLNDKSEFNFYKNKFTTNLEIYFQDQYIYLKDDKNLYRVSE